MTGQQLIDFIDQNVPRRETGGTWKLADYQRAVLLRMYERDYAIRLWSEPKKSGKTFLAGCMAIAEAILNPDSEIVIISNDKDQSKARVFKTVCQLIAKNADLSSSARILTDEVRFTNGSLIKAVSKDFRGEAGGRQRLTIGDEIWGFDSETATRFFEEMTPPPTIPDAYILIVSYAGFTGEGELLEGLYQRGLKGKRIDKKLEVYRADGLCMFWSHKPRQWWQLGDYGKKYYAEQRRILRRNQYLRLHENRWVSSESTFITPEAWDAVIDRSWTPLLGNAAVHVGVDIGVKNDSTGVVGVIRDGDRVKIAFHRCWKPFLGRPVNLDDVEQYIKEQAQKFQFVGAYADPSQCLHLIQRLFAAGITVAEFAQSVSNCVQMGQTLFTLVNDRNLVAYDSTELKEHVTNAVGQETERGIRMVKSVQRKKIDLAIALAMACVSAIKGPVALDLGQMYAGGDRTMKRGQDWGDTPSNLQPMDAAIDQARRQNKFW